MKIIAGKEAIMKAWICNTNNSEGSVIIFAETRNIARQKALATELLEEEAYIDIQAKRCKEIDNMENCKPRDNYWLNDEIRLILVKKYDWACVEPQYSDCDVCIAKQYCHWHE